MKKVIIFFALVLMSISPIYPQALHAFAAASTPHVVISGEVWLLGENGNKLFLLPDTYYARINNLDEAYYFITFNGVSGKVSKNVVSTTGYHTTATGTTAELQVSSDYLEFVSINLKSEPSVAAANVAAMPVTDSFTFIGEYPTGDGSWYYVKYNQFLGYIRSDRTNIPDITISAFVPDAAPADPVAAEPEKESNPVTDLFNGLEGNTVRIIVIVALAVPALILIFILFRPKKGKKEKYYDD